MTPRRYRRCTVPWSRFDRHGPWRPRGRRGSSAGARMQRLAVLFGEQNAQRQWKGVKSFAHEGVMQLLDARFVADRRIGIRLARRRIRRIYAVLAVHAVEVLGLHIVWLEIVVSERPGGRDPAVMPDLAEILPAQPEQRRPVHLGVAADVIMNPGMEGASVAALPGLLRLVFRLNEYRGRIPILPLPRQIIPALQQQDALARRGEPVSQRAPSRAAADNDEIVTVRHAPAKCQRGTNSALAGSGSPLQPRTG